MSETDQYWQYAREAMLSVGSATNDEERRDLLELRGPGRKRQCKRERVL